MVERERLAVRSVLVVYTWGPLGEAICIILSERGYDADTYPPSIGTHAAVAALRPDLVVLDLTDLSNVELYEVLRQSELTAHIPCLITVLPWAGAPEPAAGVTTLAAPFTSEELLGAVARALGLE